jgi:hypothetical protein
MTKLHGLNSPRQGHQYDIYRTTDKQTLGATKYES